MFRTEEYEALRSAAALVEQPCRARLRITGRNRLDLLHRMTSQDLRTLPVGEGRTAVLLNDKGRIVDHLTLYAREEELLVLCARADASPSLAHLKRYTIRDDFKPLDQTGETALLQVLGPRSAEILAAAGAAPAADPSGAGAPAKLTLRSLGAEEFLLAIDGPAAANFALWMPAGRAAHWRERLLASGRPLGLRPAGEETYEIFRLERGWPRFGCELSEEINPLEAGLNPSIHWNKGCYIGQEVIARLDTYHKVQRHLVGLRLGAESAPPPPGAAVLANGQPAGAITSSARSPALGESVALAYVKTAHAASGTPLEVRTDSVTLRATVATLPFA